MVSEFSGFVHRGHAIDGYYQAELNAVIKAATKKPSSYSLGWIVSTMHMRSVLEALKIPGLSPPLRLHTSIEARNLKNAPLCVQACDAGCRQPEAGISGRL